MARGADTSFHALALPLALLFALAQGGSCRGGAATNAANTSNRANTPAAAAPAPPLNRAAGDGSRAVVAAQGDTAVKRTNEAAGGGDVAAGMWGGERVRLVVRGDGAEVEFDCAHGRIDGRLRLDADGRFDAAGTFVAEHGGPVREGAREEGQPARYSGRVRGKTMTLSVRLAGPDEDAETFTLTHGREAELTKCL